MICKICKKELQDYNFWDDKNNKQCDICKDCMIKIFNLDTNNPESSSLIFEYFDIPIIKSIWEQYANPGATTIFGKYLARMKLGNLKPLTYNDTENLKEMGW